MIFSIFVFEDGVSIVFKQPYLGQNIPDFAVFGLKYCHSGYYFVIWAKIFPNSIVLD